MPYNKKNVYLQYLASDFSSNSDTFDMVWDSKRLLVSTHLDISLLEIHFKDINHYPEALQANGIHGTLDNDNRLYNLHGGIFKDGIRQLANGCAVLCIWPLFILFTNQLILLTLTVEILNVNSIEKWLNVLAQLRSIIRCNSEHSSFYY